MEKDSQINQRMKDRFLKDFRAPLPTRLRGLLSSRNITQKALADAIGVKTQSMSQYLNGTIRPTLSTLVEIADYFNISVDYLLGRTDVESLDAEAQVLSSVTGFSGKSLEKLAAHREIQAALNHLLEDPDAEELCNLLCGYNAFSIDSIGSDGAVDVVLKMFEVAEWEGIKKLIQSIFHGKPKEKPFYPTHKITKGIKERITKCIEDEDDLWLDGLDPLEDEDAEEKS